MNRALLVSASAVIALTMTTFIEREELAKEPLYGLGIIGFLILAAGIISLETRISTSILELIIGGVAALTPLSILASGETLTILSEFGSIVLMFIAGTEIDVYVLRKRIKESVILGFLSFALPFTSALILLHVLFNINGARAFLIATGVSTTSVAIIYVALKDLKIFNSELGQAMFAGAMVTDILSMISLSITLGQFTIFSIAYPVVILLVVLVLPSVLRSFVKLEAPWSLELKFILLVLIVLALLSEELGVHSAITSFIVGLAFAETVKSHEVLEEKIKGIGFSFFIPIFFFRAGLLIDYYGLLEVLPLFFTISTAAILTKYLGAYVPLRVMFKVSNKKLPFLFNARLAIGTIAAIYGLEYGVIGVPEYSTILTLVILSSIPVALVLHKMPSLTVEEL